MESTGAWTLDAQEYATEPAMIADGAGGLWLAWASRSSLEAGGRERIKVARLEGEGPWASAEASAVTLSGGGQASWPALAALDGGLLVVWVEIDASDRGSGGRLLACQLDGAGKPGAVRELRRAEALRRPSVVKLGAGAAIACECQDAGEHRIEWLALEGTVVARLEILDRSTAAMRCRPAQAARGDEVAVVWESHDRGRIALRGALVRGEGVGHLGLLAGGDGFNQAPSLAWDGSGRLWVAFGSDVWEPQRAATLARWVKLLCVVLDEGGAPRLMAPPEPPLGLALEARGEDQSLEFPSVAVGPDGGVWVVARASHNTRLQSFGAEGWGEPASLEPVMWGCRGTRISLLIQGDGLLAAQHGRKGVEIRRAALEAVGAPRNLVDAAPRLRPQAERGQERPIWRGQGAFWGDIHFHSAHSDGVGTVEEAHLRCRDRYGLDFACLTDHDGFIGRRVTDSVWRMMVDVAETFNRPEAGFATLIGIEYTGPRYPGPGHKCLYFDGPQAPVVCRWDGLEEAEALLERVGRLGGIAIPHHVGWLGGDPERHDPKLQPCWEICSTHGQYECEPDEAAAPPLGQRLGLPEHQEALRGHFIRRQLEAGQVFGFLGGSDGHGLMWHHGISAKADSHTTGLTGVWLDRLGRAGIMDAIRARRTWATSGGRLALAFSANGRPQGAIIDPPGPGGLQVEIHFSGQAPLQRIDVLAPLGGATCPVATVQGGGAERAVDLSLSIPPGAFDAARGFVYVRAIQIDGETAWASPCFWGVG